VTSIQGIVVGGGAVGVEFHVPRLLDIIGCSEVTVVENSALQCDRLRKKFARNSLIKIVDAIPHGAYDLAVVSTPPKFHFECFDALKESCHHIVIEKPLTKTLAEAYKLNALADEFDVKTYVGLIRRSLTNFALLKNWIDSDVFGRLHSVVVAEGLIFSWNAVSVGSFSRDLNGGGVLMDTGPHTLDQLFQLFDSLVLVSAKLDALATDVGDAIEANATIELTCGEGRPITLLLSRNRALSNTAKFKFDKATVELALHSNSIRIIDESGNGMHGLPNDVDADMNYPQMFDAYYRKFILNRNNCGVSGPESNRLLKLIEEIYSTAELMERSF